MRITMTRDEQFGEEGDAFEAALQAALPGALHARAERSGYAAPAGLEQRLLARLAQAADGLTGLTLGENEAAHGAGRPMVSRPMFASLEIGKTPRSSQSLWTALGLHGLALALLAFVVTAQVQHLARRPVVETEILTVPPPPLPVSPANDRSGGGGGQHDPSPVSQGRLPKPAAEQLLKPTQAPRIPPSLPVEPTMVVQNDLKMARNDMLNLGLPNSSLNGVSLGNGGGTGIGAGFGAGVGTGSGTNTGGGAVHTGGSVQKPELIFQPEAEFSEEARKAKFSGNVEVYLWVDERGNPSHIRVVRGVGMGLDEKALEAVRQYRFKPATQNGKAVKVDLYVEVTFTIL